MSKSWCLLTYSWSPVQSAIKTHQAIPHPPPLTPPPPLHFPFKNWRNAPHTWFYVLEIQLSASCMCLLAFTLGQHPTNGDTHATQRISLRELSVSQSTHVGKLRAGRASLGIWGATCRPWALLHTAFAWQVPLRQTSCLCVAAPP